MLYRLGRPLHRIAIEDARGLLPARGLDTEVWSSGSWSFLPGNLPSALLVGAIMITILKRLVQLVLSWIFGKI